MSIRAPLGYIQYCSQATASHNSIEATIPLTLNSDVVMSLFNNNILNIRAKIYQDLTSDKSNSKLNNL